MTTLYIISEVGWDYDDNNYYSHDGVHPTKAFRSKQKALEELDKISLHRFKENFSEINYYGYDEVFDSDSAEQSKIFEKLFQTDLPGFTRTQNIQFVVQPSEADWKELYNCCNIRWYSIAEIEVEDI